MVLSNTLQKETKDQLLSVNVPVPPNLVGQTLLNIGTTKNTGFEANVNFNAVDNGNFSWTTGVVFGTNTSELMSWTKGDLSFSGGVLYTELVWDRLAKVMFH